MSVRLLTEHHLEVLSLKVGCTGTSESTLVKMPHYWKSYVAAHIEFCREIRLRSAYASTQSDQSLCCALHADSEDSGVTALMS